MAEAAPPSVTEALCDAIRFAAGGFEDIVLLDPQTVQASRALMALRALEQQLGEALQAQDAR